MAGALALEAMTARPLLGAGATLFADRPAGQLAAIILFYQVAGSLACTKAGAQPSFPTRAEIDKAAG